MRIERALPGLGHVYLQSEGLSSCLVLTLDGYQSRCPRAWLEARWAVPALIGCTIDFDDGGLVLSKRIEVKDNAELVLDLWVAAVREGIGAGVAVPDPKASGVHPESQAKPTSESQLAPQTKNSN